MTDFLKHFFLIFRGLVELITSLLSRILKKLTQILKVLPSPMRVIRNMLRGLNVFINSYFVVNILLKDKLFDTLYRIGH